MEDHEIKHMVKGPGPASMLHQSFEAAHDQARNLSAANPDCEYYVMQSVRKYGPIDDSFVPPHMRDPVAYKKFQSRLVDIEHHYLVGPDAGNLSGLVARVDSQDSFDSLLWLVHPMHLTPLGFQEVRELLHGVTGIEGSKGRIVEPEWFEAPRGSPIFRQRVEHRSTLVSVHADSYY